jgi:hypothetical protein
LTHLRTQKTILGIILTLLLSVAGAFAQEQISPEKMKELRKYDPADVVPEAREGEPGERQDGRRRTGQQSKRNAGTSASSTPISAAVDSTLPNPQAAPAAKAPTAPRTGPSLAPKSAVVLSQSAVTKTQASEPAAPSVPAPAAVVNRSASSSRLSLPLIIFLLSLTLLALVGVAVKMKKDLSKL